MKKAEQHTSAGKHRLHTLFFVGLTGPVIGALQPCGVEDLFTLAQQLAATPSYLLLVAPGMMALVTQKD